jgi:hypothetical protein
LPIQNHMKQRNFQKFCQNHWTLVPIFVYWQQVRYRHLCTYMRVHRYLHIDLHIVFLIHNLKISSFVRYGTVSTNTDTVRYGACICLNNQFSEVSEH